MGIGSQRINRIFECAGGRWREILLACGIGEEFLRKKAGPCPICGGRDRYVFDDKFGRGNYFCRQCGAGNGLELIAKYHGCSIWDAVKRVEEILCLDPIESPAPKKAAPGFTDEEKREYARRREIERIWNDAKPIAKGDPVDLYLRSRGIDPACAQGEARCHANLEYYAGEGVPKSFHPAMVCRVLDSDGNMVNIHRTYLTQDGKKAAVGSVKKMMSGSIRGGAVKFGSGGSSLALCEGIETALSVKGVFMMPTWACLGVTNLQAQEKFPEEVRSIIVFADNDENFVGQLGAYTLAHKLYGMGYKVVVKIADRAGKDWQDDLGS